MKSDRNTFALLLGALRLPGAGAFAMPRLATRVLSLERGPHSAYLVRLFAARNVALTAGLLLSAPPARRLWWQTGIACDALDVAAGLLALREGKARGSAFVDVGAAGLATMLGLAGLRADRGTAR
jgi:hypothetical protein